MIGCNSTDEELEQFRHDLSEERAARVKVLEAENETLRRELAAALAENNRLESRIDHLEDRIEDLLDDGEY